MTQSTLRWAWHFLRRDAQSGELRVLVAALVVAVTSITAVAFFTDRLQGALEMQANELLGGDVALGSSEPLPGEFAARAHSSGLKSADTVEFPSMVLAGERNELASIKGVSEEFPLRGSLRVAPALFAADAPAAHGPRRGTIWLESRLAAALQLDVGGTLSLGASELTVSGIVTTEPGRAAGNVFALAPRVLVHKDDLAATQLITPASRVRYQLLVAGETKALQRWRDDIRSQLQPGQRIQGIDEARPEIRTALDRASRFLSLAALTSVLLAGVAIAMAVHRYALRHLDHCAILRCLGASQSFITRVFTTVILMVGAAATIVGIAGGAVAQFGLSATLGALADVSLPWPSWRPVGLGVAVGAITLLGFGLPPLLRLKTVTPLRVLRRDLGWLPPRSAAIYGVGVGAFALLVMWQAADVKLGAVVLIGVAVTAALLALMSWATLALLRPLLRHGGGWRIGWRNVVGRRGSSVLQTVAFGVSVMVLLLLGIVRDDLLRDWLKTLPADAPNRFLINIQPQQVDALGDWLHNQGLNDVAVYPMVRGRLVAINDRAVAPEDYKDDHTKRLVDREFNLSWSADMPPGNSLTGGQWWSDSGADQLSVEQGIAKDLGIQLGDRLTFRVAAQEVTATVRSLRQVQWDSFRVNFFVVAPRGLFNDFPATYITSFYLPPDRAAILNNLIRTFPNVTVIDVAAMLDQVRSIMTRVTQAVEWVFLFTLAAGLVVFYAALQASWGERLFEAAMLRTLGATRAQLRGALLGEFALLGMLAGGVAATGAALSGYLIALRVLDITYEPTGWLWLIGMLVGGVGIAVAGWWGARRILRQPPLTVLRRSMV